MKENVTILSKIEIRLTETMKKKGELVEKVKEDESFREALNACEGTLKTLRLIKAELIKKNDKREYTLPENKEIDVLLGMKDERNKYIDVYKKAKRDELAEVLEKENKIISEFVPALPSDDEVKAYAEQVVKEYLASKPEGYEPSKRDMGAVMPLVKTKYPMAKGNIVQEALLGS